MTADAQPAPLTDADLDAIAGRADETLQDASGFPPQYEQGLNAKTTIALVAEVRRLRAFEAFVREAMGPECPSHGSGTENYPCPEGCPYGVGL